MSKLRNGLCKFLAGVAIRAFTNLSVITSNYWDAYMFLRDMPYYVVDLQRVCIVRSDFSASESFVCVNYGLILSAGNAIRRYVVDGQGNMLLLKMDDQIIPCIS